MIARLVSPLRWLATLVFVGIGITHFTNTEDFIAIVPEALPEPLLLVHLSGVCEILGGIGLQVRPVRRLAGWGLIALLVSVFPANINMAVNEIYIGNMPHNPLLLWGRLPVQILFIAWIWGVALKRDTGGAGELA